MQNKVVPNREYKSGLFAFIFHRKEDLLSLYNAVNESDYADPDELEIYTMEGFIYMGMKNDLAFLIDSRLAVFEHQSTYNPNMPLRGFIYMAAALKKYIALNKLDIYSSRCLAIPVPRYYVFYNGSRQMEDETILRLTDSMEGGDAVKESCAEFKAHMININEGHSPKIMEKCPLLYEYSYFVAAVRRHIVGRDSLLEAIDMAVEECIREGILADILRAHRAEVTEMLLKEYDEEFHISCEKKISYEDGYDSGYDSGYDAGVKQEKARAEEADRRADEANRKVEILTRKLRGCSDEEIADVLNVSVDVVRECIAGIERGS